MYVNTYGMRPTAAAMMHLIGHSEGGFNHGHFHPDVQPEFDEVIGQAITTVDMEERKQYITEAMEMFQEHCGMIIPFFSSATGAKANYVEDYQLDPTTLAMFLEDVRLGEGAPDRS
jgi:ABC-type transport system substrate-binding protein